MKREETIRDKRIIPRSARNREPGDEASAIAKKTGAGGNVIMSEWIGREELARELGITPRTLAKWATARIGPPMVRVGRRVFYRRAAVREWLKRQERGKQ